MNIASDEPSAPTIHRLTIDRFRGIKNLEWYPATGLNIILGGGDTGKSTVLEAIALLFSPTNSTILSDADYWHRNSEDGFEIETVISLPPSSGINQQTKNAWPWHWDGKEPQLPKLDDENHAAQRAVYRLRVRGTSDFDLAYEVLQPDGTADHFSVSIRRAIGVVRLGGDDRNDRDLRLVQGSALDRLLSDKTLRARLGKELSATEVGGHLKDDAKEKLKQLDTAFQNQALPSALALGFTGGQGFSISALIGLTAGKGGTQLPLASWGAGTRRLAALEIAASQQGEYPITIVDELERGLEPYRQRILVAALQGRKPQAFLTTHSAAVLSCATDASLWYLDASGKIGALPKRIIGPHQQRDPEMFLARLTIVTEGLTEFGFVKFFLEKNVTKSLLEHGVWIANAEGNDAALDLLEVLALSGMKFGGFVDNEDSFPDRWKAVQTNLGSLLFRWTKGCTEENIIRLIPADRLEELIKDPNDDNLTGERLRTLADRLEIQDKSFAAIKAKAKNLPELIIAAATGSIPDDKKDASPSTKKELKKHAQRWFKSKQGGRELAQKAVALGVIPQIQPGLLPFLNSVRSLLSLSEVSSIAI